MALTRAVTVDVLLGITALGTLFTAVAIWVVRDFYERLHYMSIPATVSIAALAAAVLVLKGFSAPSAKTVLTVAIVIVMNPILTHATARAARVHEKGQWMPTTDENVEIIDTGRIVKNSK